MRLRRCSVCRTFHNNDGCLKCQLKEERELRKSLQDLAKNRLWGLHGVEAVLAGDLIDRGRKLDEKEKQGT